jgi:hypothetical protein
MATNQGAATATATMIAPAIARTGRRTCWRSSQQIGMTTSAGTTIAIGP